MKYVIGAVIGILVYHYYPSETRDLAAKAGAMVHEGAVKAAEITKQ
jgi:hypothetical protein